MQDLAKWQRSCRCTEVDETCLGQELTLMGWCQRQRDLGALVFISLRDRSGEIQLVIDKNSPAAVLELATKVRSEDVLAATGTFRERQDPNQEQKTGLWELHVQDLEILNKAITPPFYIERDLEVKDSLRLAHRYLDLRRPDLQERIMLRSDINQFTRQFFYEQGFIDIETPILGKSTPEGARDYLVPSRVFPGEFFALPQSPQLFKQLLMVAGYDRYIQIARCFRDEDLRADRQPEFTQLDLEMSFMSEEEIRSLMEDYLIALWQHFKGVELSKPFPVLSWQESMERFGVDRPDTRFALELQNISEFFVNTEFKVFASILEQGGSIQALVVPGGASAFSRREIDKLSDFVADFGAKGVSWLAVEAEWRGSIVRFVDEALQAKLKEQLSLAEGDLILIVADSDIAVVRAALGNLRLELARRLDLIDESQDHFLWVVDFPLFHYDDEEERYVAEHHPFTAPKQADLKYLEEDPSKVRARSYDIILNGVELGGGSIRINDLELQEKIFHIIGLEEAEAKEQFSFLLEALSYGAPPHGGIALGFDRLVMLLAEVDNLREVIAFPKVQSSADLMTKAPSTVSSKQLEELALSVVEEE